MHVCATHWSESKELSKSSHTMLTNLPFSNLSVPNRSRPTLLLYDKRAISSISTASQIMLSPICSTFYYKILMLKAHMKVGLKEKRECNVASKKKLVLRPVWLWLLRHCCRDFPSWLTNWSVHWSIHACSVSMHLNSWLVKHINPYPPQSIECSCYPA